MYGGIPAIEIANDRNRTRMRCPYGKPDTRRTIHLYGMCAKKTVGMKGLSGVEQIQVFI